MGAAGRKVLRGDGLNLTFCRNNSVGCSAHQSNVERDAQVRVTNTRRLDRRSDEGVRNGYSREAIPHSPPKPKHGRYPCHQHALGDCLVVVRWSPDILAGAIDVPSEVVAAWLAGAVVVPAKVGAWIEALCFVHEVAEAATMRCYDDLARRHRASLFPHGQGLKFDFLKTPSAQKLDDFRLIQDSAITGQPTADVEPPTTRLASNRNRFWKKRIPEKLTHPGSKAAIA